MTVVGIAQITGEPGQVEENRQRTVDAVRAAAAEGATLVVLPELIVPGYTLDEAILERSAETVDGATAALWSGLARETGAIVVGGLCERAGGQRYNAVLGIGPQGVVLHYRKLHLFAGERAVFAPGDLGLPIADTPAGRLGVCVCYDLRFPEIVRVLALRGAEIVCVPSAWVAGFDAAEDTRTHGCAQSDGAQLQANMSQVYLACASQAGDGGDFGFLGSSLLVDPWGVAVVGPRSRSETWIGVGQAEVAEVRRAQERGEGIRPRRDRRTDVYTLRYGGEDF